MTHWKKLTNPDYLGAYSIEDGKDLILTIAYVRQEKVIGTDGKKEDWFKYERPKVLQDEYGRAVQANFAVIDTLKFADDACDNHSSKNITIPLNPGLLLHVEANKTKSVAITINTNFLQKILLLKSILRQFIFFTSALLLIASIIYYKSTYCININCSCSSSNCRFIILNIINSPCRNRIVFSIRVIFFYIN